MTDRTGERRWYIVGCYLVPGDDTTVWDVEAAMVERPRRTELIAAGDFNMDLDKTGGQGQDKEIVATVATEGLEYLAGQFLPRWQAWYNDRRTWAVVRQRRVVRYRTD